MTTSDDAKRKILEKVADGSLSPTEAAEQLAALGRDDAGTQRPLDDDTRAESPRTEPAATAAGSPTIDQVKVVGTFRAVEIVGDPSVIEAVANGRHVARREGDTFVIDGGGFEDLVGDSDDDDDNDWFSFRNWQGPGRGYRFGGPGGRRRISALRVHAGDVLQVRMNPTLGLDAKVEAGPLTIKDVHGPIRARVAAGPLKLTGFEGPIDLHVAAGPIKADGVLDHGESRIQCEAGSVHLHLDDDASVRVRAAATLGKVNMPGGRRKHWDDDDERGFHWEDIAASGGVSRVVGDVLGKLGDTREMTFGAGAGTLDIEVSMGAIHVSAD